MRNIYSRSKFKTLNEDSSTVKDVANVSNEPAEIVKAWNLSLVGALTNGIVGGVFNTLKRIYKWGRKKWAMNNLLSKLNKEFLKGMIFFADDKNINLEKGEILKSTEVEAQSDEEKTTQVQDKRQTALDEVDKLLAGIDSIEEFEINKEIKEWKAAYGKKKRDLQSINTYIKTYKSQLETAPREKKAGFQRMLEKYIKLKKEAEQDFEQLQEINDKINKKYIELGGHPEEVGKEEVEKTRFEKAIEKVKKASDEQGFDPTQPYDSGLGKFVDYPKFKELYKRPKKEKIQVGDQFVTYLRQTGERSIVQVKSLGDNPDTVVAVNDKNKSGFPLEVENILPVNMPNFEVLNNLENFLMKFGPIYDKLEDNNRELLLDIYRKYTIIKKIKSELKKEGIVLDKKNIVSESLILEKTLKLKGKGTGSIEGGDLQGDIPLTDILTQKEQDKIKNKELINLSVGDINFGQFAQLMKSFDKTEAAKHVNKYNLEVIRLLADKYFEGDNAKKEWAKKVNRVNAYWDDIFNIDDVNVLKTSPFTSDAKLNDSVKKNSATNDAVYNLSVLNETGLGGKDVVIKNLGDGENIITTIIYNGEPLILPTKPFSSGLEKFNKSLFGVSTILEIKEKDGKNYIENNDDKFANTFQRKNGVLIVDDNNVTSYSPEIKTFLLFSNNQRVPKNVNNTQPAKIIVVNEITLRYTGGKTVRGVYFFDNTEHKNISSKSIIDGKKIPEIDIKLVSMKTVTGDVDNKIMQKTKFEKITKSTINDEMPKLISSFQSKKKS